MAGKSELASLRLPEFGLPSVEPEVKPGTYMRRLERLRVGAGEAGHDVFVVYGDHEHSANLSYLTGYDPRFEESLFIMDLRPDHAGKPRLLVGNVGWGFCNVSPVIKELGIVLADAGLRDTLERDYPEVLPTSNIHAYLPPYLLSPRKVMRMARA